MFGDTFAFSLIIADGSMVPKGYFLSSKRKYNNFMNASLGLLYIIAVLFLKSFILFAVSSLKIKALALLFKAASKYLSLSIQTIELSIISLIGERVVISFSSSPIIFCA